MNTNVIQIVQGISQMIGSPETAGAVFKYYLESVTTYRNTGWDLTQASQRALDDLSQSLGAFQQSVSQSGAVQFGQAHRRAG